MPCYFAYGSNLSLARLRERIGIALPLGVAELPDYRLVCDKRGADGSAKANLTHSAIPVRDGFPWHPAQLLHNPKIRRTFGLTLAVGVIIARWRGLFFLRGFLGRGNRWLIGLDDVRRRSGGGLITDGGPREVGNIQPEARSKAIRVTVGKRLPVRFEYRFHSRRIDTCSGFLAVGLR